MDRAIVAIVGATGVTGGYAFDAAIALGLEPIALGRDGDRLAAFLAGRGLAPDRSRIVDIHDLADLHRALAGVAVVISTVAPFKDHGFTIARAAAELGLGYTDPSGETGFIRKVGDQLDSVALGSGATLCPGNGGSAFLGDLAIQSIVDPARDRVGAVMYDIQDYTPTWGSLKSYLSSILPSGAPHIRNGHIETRPFADYAGQVAGLAGYNSIVPDALVISRYWKPDRFDGMAKGGGLSRPLARLAAAAVTDTRLARMLLKLPFDKWLAYDPAKDARSSVTAYAQVGTGDGSYRRRTVRGEAIYPLTGHILAATARAMLERRPRPAGVRAASEMFASFEQALTLTGIQALD